MQNEFDAILKNAIMKTKNKYGNSLILTNYIEYIGKYFLKEYHINNYDYDNLLNDICEIANNSLQLEPFNKLNDILNQDEIEVIVTSAYEEIFTFLKVTGYIQDV